MKDSILIDSNIIIYAASPKYASLRKFIETETPLVSVISKIETLGYHKLQENDKTFLNDFFNAAIVLPISQVIVQLAIRLRQERSISLGDSLIGATALSHGLKLATHNIGDFDWISGLDLIDPLYDN
jgi:predicted nucleic acid-binding protein